MIVAISILFYILGVYTFARWFYLTFEPDEPEEKDWRHNRRTIYTVRSKKTKVKYGFHQANDGTEPVKYAMARAWFWPIFVFIYFVEIVIIKQLEKIEL